MDNTRNLLWTISLSVCILVLWQYFFVNPQLEAERQAQLERQQAVEQSQQTGGATDTIAEGEIPQSTINPATPATPVTRDEAIATGQRVTIETEALTGSINLTGARLDDLSLKRYRQTVDENSPIVEFLSPRGTERAYFAEFGYAGPEGVPADTAVWSAPEGATLTTSTPVTLTYQAPNGLLFERQIAVDDNYLFTITDTITNNGQGAVALQNYGRVLRSFNIATRPNWLVHEGMIGVTDEDNLSLITFNNLEDGAVETLSKTNEGWLGITDKYWGAVIIPQSDNAFTPKFSHLTSGWQSDFLADPVAINAGQSATVTNLLYAGAKVSSVISQYEDEYSIRLFNRMIDWGWFHYITRPLFAGLDWLNGLIGNFGVAILIMTVFIKLLFFPLANKSYASMARMKVVQPKMQEIKERYGDDREKMQKAMMELYRKEKINPIAGCWPVLIQIPVFFALYKVLFVTIEMRHAPFFGWIQDLSAPDPTTIFNLFGLLPFDPGAIPVIGFLLMLGVWPILMGITMFVQMQMNPAPPDPTQAMIFKWMPIIFTFMLAGFPAGLVIYWAWNNFLSVLQQGFIMKKHGAPIALWDNIRGMFGKKDKESV